MRFDAMRYDALLWWQVPHTCCTRPPCELVLVLPGLYRLYLQTGLVPRTPVALTSRTKPHERLQLAQVPVPCTRAAGPPIGPQPRHGEMSGWCRKARGQSEGQRESGLRPLIGCRRSPSSSQPLSLASFLFIGSCSPEARVQSTYMD